jgi:putative zinc finger/helix-turn-helix YgiT family protein
LKAESRQIKARDGTLLPYKSNYSLCDECGEEFYTREQGRHASRSATSALRLHNGRLSPFEIIEIRKTHGVSQGELEQILGFGKKSLVRWEAGTVEQSSAADTLLREVRDSPEMFRRLAERAGVRILQPTRTSAWGDLFSELISGSAVQMTIAGSAIVGGVPGMVSAGAFTSGKVGWASFEPATVGIKMGASDDRVDGWTSPPLFYRIVL